MEKFLIKTKGNTDPRGKRKVYFTCYPTDFEHYFDKICEDIFRTHDCAIYFTEDMTEMIDDEDKMTSLGQMNLFVVPVTFRLLSKPNRAMDEDIAYAKREHIPILPLMMENGIDKIYGLPEKFGELQYLNPYSTDLTEIGYEQKLKKYLESVLITDEMIKRIRAAFDAYIFLSYRKKDRRYANELMQMIHRIPEYRDIAIWYDEFLTPGESFRQNIEKALHESKLFALLVTPSLLEMVDGHPNFVMAEEYPAARKAEMTILPTEMVETNKEELHDKYKDIPVCANPKDEESFRERFLDVLKRVAVSENNQDPVHNFLIGLAYLDGIDVEINRERGLECVISAAEGGLIEAVEKLRDMYSKGKGVAINYEKAVRWGEQAVAYCEEHEGEESEHLLTAWHRLAVIYGNLNQFEKTKELLEKVYQCEYKFRGEYHEHTLDAWNNLAFAYGNLGEYRKALEMHEKIYRLQCDILGKTHRSTLVSLNNMAMIYIELSDYDSALKFNQEAYDLRREQFGDADSDTILSLNNLAYTYGKRKDFEKALELYKKTYELSCSVFGEDSLNVVSVLNNLANTYAELKMFEKEIEAREKICVLSDKIFGEDSMNTITFMRNLAFSYEDFGDYEKSAQIFENIHSLSCKMFGEKHPLTLQILSMLALSYRKCGNEEKCRELMKEYFKHSFERQN